MPFESTQTTRNSSSSCIKQNSVQFNFFSFLWKPCLLLSCCLCGTDLAALMTIIDELVPALCNFVIFYIILHVPMNPTNRCCYIKYLYKNNNKIFTGAVLLVCLVRAVFLIWFLEKKQWNSTERKWKARQNSKDMK